MADLIGHLFPLIPGLTRDLLPSCPALSRHPGHPGSPAAGPLPPAWTPSVKICL